MFCPLEWGPWQCISFYGRVVAWHQGVSSGFAESACVAGYGSCLTQFPGACVALRLTTLDSSHDPFAKLRVICILIPVGVCSVLIRVPCEELLFILFSFFLVRGWQYTFLVRFDVYLGVVKLVSPERLQGRLLSWCGKAGWWISRCL